MYMALKHTHLLLIVLSAVLFIFRFGLKVTDSPLLQKRALKIAPHAIDTFLLLSGVALVMLTGFMPFTPAGEWLTTKLSCVLAYIALGVFAFRSHSRLFQTFCFLGAMGWLVMAYNIAVTKSTTLFG
ncbi:SirB2 family protein [Thaumasiovibrio subtropicus]|uniref:SirB2 family protein n=1 Tax=Thaumasiovibrio subtropicus TaxID=1891207 RepID=UPI000B35A5DF|nr:SirB2 family protein [Thaumasiovibrio subtropicus]